MNKKFKTVMVNIPPISTKQTITCHLKSLNTKRLMTYDVGNPDPALGQAQQCGRVNGIPILPFFISGSPTDINNCLKIRIRFYSKGPHNFTKMNYDMNMYSTIPGPMNAQS